MVSGDNVTVTLTGGAPWGFRLTGGGSMPLQIAKIRKKSQAHAHGLQEGDAVVSVNGTPVHDRSHDEALELIDNAGDTLTLQIYRGEADDLGHVLASSKPHAPLFPPQAEGDAPSAAAVTSSTTHSVDDDGRTRREVQREVFESAGDDGSGTTFVRREKTVTTTTSSSVDVVNGNEGGDGGGGFIITASVDVDESRPQALPATLFAHSPRALSPQVTPVVNSNEGGDGGGGFIITASVDVDESRPQTLPATLFAHSPRALSPQVTPKPVSPLTVDVAQATITLSPGAALSPYTSPTAAPRQASSPQPPPVAPKPAFSPQAQTRPAGGSPQVPRGPTFKAVPPKVAPDVPPKPVVVGGQVVTSDPLLSPNAQFPFRPTFNAKASAQVAPPASFYSPAAFQVQATAMYNQQTYAPASPSTYNPPPKSPQTFSPTSRGPQLPTYHSPPQPFNRGQQTYKQVNRQVSSTSSTTTSKQLFSPMSVSPGTPVSPDNPPYSPASGLLLGPQFHVRNNLGEGSNVWQPNMWLPGQEPEKAQARRQHSRQQDALNNNEDAEGPRRMTIKERQQMLLSNTAATKHSLSARQADPDFDAPPEEVQREMARGGGRLHVFGPPVETSGPGGHLVFDGFDSCGSEPSSPTSSLLRHRRKMYSDSAFYEDPTHKYPTIEEQMKLCRLISHSLTSAANRRARGAKMFAKRRKRSNKWVHEGHVDWGSSSAGDVANLEELDSELDVTDGGSRTLFTFRIPNVKHRVAPPEQNTRMALKKDEFERLRLQAQKCEHTAVTPNTCFDIVADLKASKGRGGRLFERRKNRADKFIIDESNARVAGPKPTRLEDLLVKGGPLKSSKSPWEAAQQNDRGSVDSAFDHLSERDRIAKMNQILKYPAPKPAVPVEALQTFNPPVVGSKTSLKDTHGPHLLKGRNFNRRARGWHSHTSDPFQQEPSLTAVHHIEPVRSTRQEPQHYSQQQQQQPPRAQYGDYNPRPRAWQPQGESLSCPPSMSASWNSTDFDNYGHHNGHGSGFYSPNDLPACDL